MISMRCGVKFLSVPDEFEELDEYDYFLFLSEGFVDLLTNAQGLNGVLLLR